MHEAHATQSAPPTLGYAGPDVDDHDPDPTGAKKLLRWLLAIIALVCAVFLLGSFIRGLFVFVF